VNLDKKNVVIVFSKSPVEGQVKTRLIPEIGKLKATELYKELLVKTLDTAVNSEASEVQIWISGDVRHDFFSRYKSKEFISFYKQEGKDLGERMFNAFTHTLIKFSYIVLIGSDCPELSISDINSAMSYLKDGADLVLGPADDGGYYLIGLRSNDADLFHNIEWGSDNVFSETYSRAKEKNLNIELLTKRYDVDRASDLSSYYKLKNKETVT
jgi:uncharacterized protein